MTASSDEQALHMKRLVVIQSVFVIILFSHKVYAQLRSDWSQLKPHNTALHRNIPRSCLSSKGCLHPVSTTVRAIETREFQSRPL